MTYHIPKSFSDFPHEPKPNDYMMLSLVSSFLNIVFGIVALYFSLQTRDAYKLGKYEDSRRYSKYALWLNLIALSTGVVLFIIGILFLVYALVRPY